jgi:hypothetical protein
MIGNKLEQSIIELFQSNISSTFSINQVSKILKKPYPLINKKINFFLQEGILKKMDIGRSYQCFLNMQSDKAKILMMINEINKKEAYIQKAKDFEAIMDEVLQLAKKFHIETIILYKKTIIFVMPNTEKKGEVLEQSMLTRDYNLLFLNRKAFQERFAIDEDFRRYHLVLYNTDIFLNMITDVAEKLLTDNLVKDRKHMDKKR